MEKFQPIHDHAATIRATVALINDLTTPEVARRGLRKWLAVLLNEYSFSNEFAIRATIETAMRAL